MINRILIREEDKNEWEKRTPLVPEDCTRLSSEIKILVEPSEKRCFCNHDFEEAGCELCEDLEQGDIIIGIKELPVEKIFADKIYMIFSHCVKGQIEGIKILKKMIHQKATLIDYEKITDSRNKRLIGFSKYAGYAGTLDALWILGKHMYQNGIDSVFRDLKGADTYKNYGQAVQILKKINKTDDRLAESDFPVIIGILGNGNIAGGVRETLDCLPITWILPSEVKQVYSRKDAKGKLYACIFWLKDLLENVETKKFIRSEYLEHPQRYRTKFGNYLNYLTVVINGLYWTNDNQHILTWEMLTKKCNSNNPILLLADIANDLEGTIECNIQYTDLKNPYYYIDPYTRKAAGTETSIAVMAAENYPAELPTDSSVYFSEKLADYITDIVAADYDLNFDEILLPEEIKKAVVVYKGELTPLYCYLNEYLKM